MPLLNSNNLENVDTSYWPQWLKKSKFQNSKIEIIAGVVRFTGTWLDGDFIGGNFWDGNFRGGNFRSGNFWDGNFRGGNFRGGDFRGGDFQSGDFRGGNFWGGNFWDGNFLSGNFLGGNFWGGDFRGGDFRGGDFQSGDFRGGNFWGGNFCGGNFRGGNFWDGNFRGGNFRGGNFNGGNLIGGKVLGGVISPLVAAKTKITPEGDLIGWKKCRYNVIVKLLIPSNAKRSNATGRKCRAEFAEVLEIFGSEQGISLKNSKFIYEKGQKVYPDKWKDDRWLECAGGIHFFLTREEAEAFEY